MIISVLSANITLLAKHRGSLRIRSTVHKNQQDSYLSSCSIGSPTSLDSFSMCTDILNPSPELGRLCRSHENHIWCLRFFWGASSVKWSNHLSLWSLDPFWSKFELNCFPKQVWWGLIHGLKKPNSIATAQQIFALVYLKLLLSDNLVNTH